MPILGFATSNDIKKLREEGLALSKTINAKLDQIIMDQAELAAALKALKEQAAKIAKEQGDKSTALAAEIKRLSDLLAAGGTVTEEVVTALGDVQAAFQALDETIPDAPVA